MQCCVATVRPILRRLLPLSSSQLIFALFLLLFISTFWLGRLSVQLGELDRLSNDAERTTKPCHQQSTRKASLSTYLMVLIMTGPDESALRRTIRQTWLRLSTKTPQQFWHLFPVGTRNLSAAQLRQLDAESTQHGDLVLLRNLTDSYEQLALKTLLSIGFAVEAVDFAFVLKTDGDSFVRLGALLQALRTVAHPFLYWGFLDGRARPKRLGGKWREEEWRLCDRYLPYQLGGGYVLSHALASFIQQNRERLKLYRNEDVSVGAWLAGLRVRYVHDPRFDTEFRSRGCNNEYLITHKKSPDEMHRLFSNLATRGVLCHPGEYQLRPSYVYDFSRPPSECCTRRNGSRIP
uniref:Hexosyltransferase n=1 Tax=Globodera rostochiensis TaxID=31243 RepID=A0A914HI38_GLORO